MQKVQALGSFGYLKVIVHIIKQLLIEPTFAMRKWFLESARHSAEFWAFGGVLLTSARHYNLKCNLPNIAAFAAMWAPTLIAQSECPRCQFWLIANLGNHLLSTLLTKTHMHHAKRWSSKKAGRNMKMNNISILVADLL